MYIAFHSLSPKCIFSFSSTPWNLLMAMHKSVSLSIRRRNKTKHSLIYRCKLTITINLENLLASSRKRAPVINKQTINHNFPCNLWCMLHIICMFYILYLIPAFLYSDKTLFYFPQNNNFDINHVRQFWLNYWITCNWLSLYKNIPKKHSLYLEKCMCYAMQCLI